MKKGFYLTTCILLSLFLFACGGEKRVHTAFGYTLTGGASDSLLMKLDRTMMSYGDPDSLERLVNRYCAMSEKEDPNDKYLHRRLYWRGNALFMKGEFEKGDSLRRLALLKCDSVAFPHDFRLYRMAIEQPSDFSDNADRYVRYKSDLDFFINSGDPVSAFSRAVMLMTLMNEAGMNKEALRYALLSDSLLSLADLPLLRENNKVNIASAYFAAGDTIKATKILNALRDSGECNSIPSIVAIIDYNLFQMTNDSLALRRAWSIVKRSEQLSKMQALVAASIINTGTSYSYNEEREELVSALHNSSEYEYNPQEELEISEAFLNLARESGDNKDIGDKTEEYKKTVKKYIEEQKKGVLISAETEEIIHEIEDREQLAKERLKRNIWIGIAVTILIIAVASIVLTRYVSRLKRDSMLRQLEHERMRREHIAKDLMLVEKQKLNEQLQSKIDDLLKKDELEVKTAEMITELMESKEIKNLLDIDDSEFLRLFMERYPKVSKTGRKLAMYIRKGHDTSQIAKELNIRKESVIQGRWRLRTQMGLSADSDLDVILRQI